MSDRIDDALWKKARELANSAGGLVIDGLGSFQGGRFTPAPGSRVDSPKLVVAVADEVGVKDDEVRSRLKHAVKQAVDSTLGHPAPLGSLGLLAQENGQLRFHPARGGSPASPDAIEAALAAWRAPADDAAAKFGNLIEALEQVQGVFSPAEVARLLDEVGYELDPAGWGRFGARLLAALPY
jgi:hypothetical protein